MNVANEARAVHASCLIPDLLRDHPQVRRVLDGHGLAGCGGHLGPHETLRFFARAHGVDEARLLVEIDEVIARPQCVAPLAAPGLADAIYRPFFLGGIAVVLTAGATWGAWILWNIALKGSFLAASVPSINAHGDAQIYGWVGLFIMGFAYQAFPRMWQTRLAAPALAWVVFAAMLIGIVVRTVAIPGAGVWSGAVAAADAGGLLQIAASAIFALQVLATFRRSGRPIEPYVAFVSVALACFVASTMFSAWHIRETLTAGSIEDLLGTIATYQVPLRDLQIHGLALLMILGVSLRMLPGLYGVAQTGRRCGWWAFGLLAAGLVGEIVLFLAYRWSGHHLPAAFLPAAWLAMSVGIALVVLPWRLWQPLPEPDRSAKFVRAAYAWLAIAMTMLLVLPLYHAVAGLRFSHAYFGATRHAITVGFISLMIMGIAAKVVPTLNGIDPARLSSLWGPFVLVNVGCALRVSLQILSDRTGRPTPWLGVSGSLEVAALSWWGFGLAALMLLPERRDLDLGPVDRPGPPRGQIEGHHRVAEVLTWYPECQEVLVRHGFEAIRNPLLRRTLARRVTIEQAARLRGLDPIALVAALRQASRPPLPILDRNCGVSGSSDAGPGTVEELSAIRELAGPREEPVPSSAGREVRGFLHGLG